jgi:hypothetical protein
MKINLCDVPVRWINVDTATENNKLMVDLLKRVGMNNARRFSAITDVLPHEGVRPGEEHYRNCAESHFSILQESIDNNSFPVCILEDDVEIEESVFTTDLENIPDDADAIYLGTSHGDNNYSATDVGNGWMKIERVFATHSILWLNEKLAREVIKTGKSWIYEKNHPFDVGIAYELQPKFNVYAPHTPFFFQADAKNSKNKWEHLTRTPLKLKRKFSVFTV